MKTINVVVGKKNNNIINTNRNPVTLKSVVTQTTRLDNLNDVVATGEVSGAVPVYDAATDKYVVQKLDLNNVTGDLDGGTF